MLGTTLLIATADGVVIPAEEVEEEVPAIGHSKS
jgi:hypothetical protein